MTLVIACGGVVLKVARRHWEAEHEAEALRVWDGNGPVRCLDARSLGTTSALLLERCVPVPGRPAGTLVAGAVHRRSRRRRCRLGT